MSALRELLGEVVVYVTGADQWPALTAMLQGEMTELQQSTFDSAKLSLLARGIDPGEETHFEVGETALFVVHRDRFESGALYSNGKVRVTSDGYEITVVPGDAIEGA